MSDGRIHFGIGDRDNLSKLASEAMRRCGNSTVRAASNHEAKSWGDRWLLFRDAIFQVALLSIRPGGYCSIHHHDTKFNTFEVVSGSLVITTYDESMRETSTCTVTTDTGARVIAPGVIHRFSSPNGAMVYEIERPKGFRILDVEDIHRRTEGGVEKK